MRFSGELSNSKKTSLDKRLYYSKECDFNKNKQDKKSNYVNYNLNKNSKP